MKKVFAGILGAALVLSAAAAPAFAAVGGPVGKGVRNLETVGRYAGSCDGMESRGKGLGAGLAMERSGSEPGGVQATETAQTVAATDLSIAPVGWGSGYVDEDGDGVCDNLGTGGWGPGYVDEDGDGVCDNLGTGARPQDGTGYRHGGGRGGRGGRWR